MSKVFLNYNQQIQKLKNEKNLLIMDEAYYFTEKNGEDQKEYLDKSNYNYSGKKNKRDIDRLIKILEGYVTKPTDYNYINHSQKNK